VAQFLRLVESGELRPGDRLPAERQLAQQLGVSRSAVREAMTALEVLGAVQIKPGVGIFIGPAALAQDGPVVDQVSDLISEEGPLEILEARSLFEPGVARLAAQRRTETNLNEMQDRITEMEEDLRRGGNSWEPDWGFHQAVATATQNPLVVSLVDLLGQRMEHQLWKLMRAHNFEAEGRAYRYLEDHRTILDAIRRSQGDLAFRAMHRHIRLIQADLEADETLAGEGSDEDERET
jgi:GntR family transcriptional repressor for pyruvate dehydrogenase complex